MVWVVMIWLVTHTLEMVKERRYHPLMDVLVVVMADRKMAPTQRSEELTKDHPVELKWLHQVVSKAEPQLLVVSVLARLLRKVKAIQPVRLAALLVAECQCQSVYKLGRTPGRQQCRVPHRVSRAVQAARCPALGGAIGQALRHRSDISRLPVLFRSSALLKSYVCLTIQVIGSCIGYPLRGQLFNLLIL
jgi:hypothetical protein